MDVDAVAAMLGEGAALGQEAAQQHRVETGGDGPRRKLADAVTELAGDHPQRGKDE